MMKHGDAISMLLSLAGGATRAQGIAWRASVIQSKLVGK